MNFYYNLMGREKIFCNFGTQTRVPAERVDDFKSIPAEDSCKPNYKGPIQVDCQTIISRDLSTDLERLMTLYRMKTSR